MLRSTSYPVGWACATRGRLDSCDVLAEAAVIIERRAFIRRVAGGLVAATLAGRARSSSLPVIGFLRSTPAAPFAGLVEAFREGLEETDYIEGRNVAIEYRWANNDRAKLPGLAAELVRRRVDVIVGNSLAAEAAKKATESIPIVFVTADDPVIRGLVTNMGRPDANVTGITFFGGGLLGAKRLEIVHEIVPNAKAYAFLMDPNWPGDFVVDGGLISYAASFASAYRQAGVYAGRILKGTKPSELPVLQPTTFELVLNASTAKALALTIPQGVLLRANEVVR